MPMSSYSVFPRSTYVHIVRHMLAHKGISYEFRDLEPETGSAVHLALHPFDRVPILRHGGFTLYGTSAIATYVDRRSKAPPLQPKDIQGRARMHQWISSVNSYYYPYMIYHVVHERHGISAAGDRHGRESRCPRHAARSRAGSR